MSLPVLIRALLDPARYPHAAAAVELVETHISWVLLAGDFAYKLKKPLTLPFLDYSTLDRRRACCEAELRLNRRYAAELYLEVVAITGAPAAPTVGGAGMPLEYAVKMRRFDEAMRLDHVCARNELTPAHMRLLAQEIADFHRGAAVAAAATRFGEPARVLAPALANVEALRDLLPLAADGRRIAALAAWTRREHARCAPALAARKQAGAIRECHGDLHLGNLVLAAGATTRILPFDCIEFNDDFRWIDVASELAFTLIDLLDHRRPDLAAALRDEWLTLTGDFDALRVLRFYGVYRALVRAKVAAMRAQQEEEPASATRDLAAARVYLDLAETLAAAPAPALTITHGLSGSGKSVAALARVQADARGATVRLRSDVERKRLFGLAATARSGSAPDAGIYTPDAHLATYRRLEELAALALAAGWSVVVDAAFLKRAERDAFRRLAAAHDAQFAILACTAPLAELRRRIAARQGDASEATLEVLEKQLQWIEPPAADEAPFVVAPTA
jgi:aminoglycoside phosphotransferase family enzyme/predicted kinase